MTYEEALLEIKALTPAKLREYAVLCEGRAAMTLAEVYFEPIYEQPGKLTAAAELLRARDTFFGRANMIDNFGPTADEFAEELAELSGPNKPIWPEISAELHQIAAADPKLQPIVDQIDKLHALAEEKGLPVITRGAFEAAMQDAV